MQLLIVAVGIKRLVTTSPAGTDGFNSIFKYQVAVLGAYIIAQNYSTGAGKREGTVCGLIHISVSRQRPVCGLYPLVTDSSKSCFIIQQDIFVRCNIGIQICGIIRRINLDTALIRDDVTIGVNIIAGIQYQVILHYNSTRSSRKSSRPRIIWVSGTEYDVVACFNSQILVSL